MLNVLIAMIACILRMIWLVLPSMIITIVGHTVIYQATGISIWNEVCKNMMKGVR